MRKEIIGDCILYLGDCLEILPTLGKVDAVVTDPPYGIGFDRENPSMSAGLRKDGTRRKYKAWSNPQPKGYETKYWDKKLSDGVFKLLFSVSGNQIIFGGNYYTLPPTGGWLIWDKGVVMPTLSKCEMAWTSMLNHTEIFRLLWAGFRKGEATDREHPTQKPVAVLEWCLSFLPAANLILDPFMGSGTTGVACCNLGRKFIGVEIEERYFNIACKRIADAYKQLPLDFGERPKTYTETSLFPSE